eukprot:TRINITY_DN3081_c0_g1_i1.p1 TRINITY_DN3081_c0_g1~~TRINITY_DN3081_c0_g1_i1.p1  ORF type:complete len:173 (-),score=29.12 TRINITY_DN3081_c0_g1_i1:217-735(-)
MKLAENVRQVTEQVAQLTTTTGILQEEHSRLSDNLNALGETVNSLQEVENALKTYAQKAQTNLGEVIGSVKGIVARQNETLKLQENLLSKTQETMKTQDKLILYQLNAQLSMQDNQLGLSPQEYSFFLSNLPASYKSVSLKRFEELDKNKDGVIDITEFQNIVDELISNTRV